jgi:hypothetical protein
VSQELIALKRLIEEQDRTSSVLADARLLLNCWKPRVIRVLHVRPSHGGPFEMERISWLTRKVPGLHIHVKGIGAGDFTKSDFTDPAVLFREFDLVSIGGSDDAEAGLDGFTREVIDRSLGLYHRAGGKILIFHDTAWERDPQQPKWTYFLEQMGTYQMFNEGTTALWTEVKRKVSSAARPEILTSPFGLILIALSEKAS